MRVTLVAFLGCVVFMIVSVTLAYRLEDAHTALQQCLSSIGG